jgi:site-specific recombinase XerD
MLTESIDRYLQVHRSLGLRFVSQEFLLRSYERFAAQRAEQHVRTTTAVEWAGSAPSAYQREHRLRVVRQFAEHARAEDTMHEVPPRSIFAQRYTRRSPYIFSPGEIERLLTAASRLRPAGIRPITYCTLFGLLDCTGMRIGEALALRVADVTQDGLVIRRSKFGKTRLVPLHATAEAALRRYLARRIQLITTTDRLFLSIRKRPLRYLPVLRTFHSLLQEVGLAKVDRRPRIHDIRHTWAVRALERSPDGPELTGRHLLAVSTYLGHANAACTYWYLQATPHLFHRIADACAPIVEGGRP